MKIDLGRNSQSTKFLDDDGRDISKHIPARRLVVIAEINEPVRAEIELAFVEVTKVESPTVEYLMGGHTVKGIITTDDKIIMLPEKDVKYDQN